MRPIVLLTPFILWLMLLASCSSPPKPPTVDESRKRPVNSVMAVELQVCRSDLQNTRLQATESGRLAQTATGTLGSLAARQEAISNGQLSAAQAVRGNSVFTVRFEFGRARVDIPAEAATLLFDEAKGSPLVLLRGRTDGLTDAPVESRIARDRAAAVRDYLVAAGVDASRIRTTYQPSGDHVADNAETGGRALNRRVEIEIYRALPVHMNVSAVPR